MIIVGLTGYARTGKDSVGALLVEVGWHRIGFADNVRALALKANPIAYGAVPLSRFVEREGWDGAKRNPEVRRFLQALGSGVRDVLGETTWIDAALPERGAIRLNADGSMPNGIVVTDVRHENEAAAIRARGGTIVRVLRSGVGPANDHITETGVDSILPDYSIVNDGSLDDLRFEVTEFLGWLIVRD